MKTFKAEYSNWKGALCIEFVYANDLAEANKICETLQGLERLIKLEEIEDDN